MHQHTNILKDFTSAYCNSDVVIHPIRLIKLVASLIFIVSWNHSGWAQSEEQDFGTGIYLGATYGVHWPGADLADRFGRNFALGGNLEVVKGQKWIFGLEGHFLFGNEVNENVAGGLVDDRGILINSAFSIADIDSKERGLHFLAKAGQIYDLWNEEHISGIKWSFGVGFLQHKIRLRDAQQAVPYFEDDYVKGYDRLTNGFALTQFIGYQYLDQRGRLNFYLGGEVTEAFTKNRRGLS